MELMWLEQELICEDRFRERVRSHVWIIMSPLQYDRVALAKNSPGAKHLETSFKQGDNWELTHFLSADHGPHYRYVSIIDADRFKYLGMCRFTFQTYMDDRLSCIFLEFIREAKHDAPRMA